MTLQITDAAMREEIMMRTTATGDIREHFWLMLQFRTRAELLEICRDLNVRLY